MTITKFMERTLPETSSIERFQKQIIDKLNAASYKSCLKFDFTQINSEVYNKEFIIFGNICYNEIIYFSTHCLHNDSIFFSLHFQDISIEFVYQ